MSLFLELPFNDFIKNMIGKKITNNDLVVICKRINEVIESADLDITLTPELIIDSFGNNSYFLKTLSFFFEGYSEEDRYLIECFVEDVSEIGDLTSLNLDYLDLIVKDVQYEQCNIMTKKRVNNIYKKANVKKLLESDLDLFVSSFDQSIEDTFSRDFFLEKIGQ